MSGPQIITLGCRLNIAESEAIREMAGGQDDLIVVNSCAVTAEAVRQTRQAIRRARRDRPEARIMVTGCAAQTEPETFAQMAEVDAVIGNREKLDPSHYPSSQRKLGSHCLADSSQRRERRSEILTFVRMTLLRSHPPGPSRE